MLAFCVNMNVSMYVQYCKCPCLVVLQGCVFAEMFALLAGNLDVCQGEGCMVCGMVCYMAVSWAREISLLGKMLLLSVYCPLYRQSSYLDRLAARGKLLDIKCIRSAACLPAESEGTLESNGWIRYGEADADVPAGCVFQG